MTDLLTDKITFITGGARGIGFAIAAKFVREGARVVIADINGEAAEEAAAQLGESASGVTLDVTDRTAVRNAIDDTAAAYGRLDVLVNNAGWDRAMPFTDTDPADWDRIIGINLYGVFHTVRAALPHFVEQGGGAIVSIASDAGRVGSSGEAVYSAAKGGIIAFTKTIARENATAGVRANTVCPGPTDTALFATFGGEGLKTAVAKAVPMKRIGTPDDIAGGVAYLASDEAAFVTGQTLSISGGLTMS